MDEETVRNIKSAVAEAYWNLTFATFCTRMGWLQDDYAKKKFKALATLADALNAFDAATLTKLLNDRF